MSGIEILSSGGSLQKFISQHELMLIQATALEAAVVPAGLGVFYLFEENRELLERFMAMIATLGRLPEADEFRAATEIEARFGSLNRAFSLVKRVTGATEWDAITRAAPKTCLFTWPSGAFRRRPPISVLPLGLQRDIRRFFGSYANGCCLADELLFKAGDADAVDEACRRSAVGKVLPNALYVHRSALDSLDPLLRVFEGCARTYLGEIEEANVIKLHRQSGKVSYLVYPDFETNPHPALLRSVKLSLRTREIDCLEYGSSPNPPVLHRKETFLLPDHPLHARFARLSAQEEKHGLLSETASIGTRDGWSAVERRRVRRAWAPTGSAEGRGLKGVGSQ